MNLNCFNLFRTALFFIALGLVGCGGGGDSASSSAAKSVTDISSSGSSKTDIENFTNYINNGTLPAAPDCTVSTSNPLCKQVSVSGIVYGLAEGQQVTLLNKGMTALTVTADGIFKIPNVIADGGSYQITIGKAPLNQSCVVVDGSGDSVHAEVTGVLVACTTYPNCVNVSPEACSLFHGMTAGINLGVPFATGVYDKMRFTDAQVEDLCKRFDTFRLMLPFFNTAAGTFNEALIAASRKAADRFVACGATVIVTHAGMPSSLGWADTTLPEARLYELWRKIGSTYQGASPKIIFELLNEPGLTQDSPRLNNVMFGMLAALRSTGVQNVAMLSPRGASEAGYLSTVVLPTDKNIVYTIHQYAPINFTSQGKWWSTVFPSGLTCCDLTQTAAIDRYLMSAGEWSRRVGYPMVVSEYGALFCGDTTSRANFFQENLTRFKKWDMTPVLFSYDDALGIYERSNMTWDPVLLPVVQLPSAGEPPAGFMGYTGKRYCK